MQYYNEKENLLWSKPPWGDSYISNKIKSEIYSNWEEKDDEFRLPSVIDKDKLIILKKQERDILLSATDWLVSRHYDETYLEKNTTLTASQYLELQTYRQELRDITDDKDFPYIDFPEKPSFLS